MAYRLPTVKRVDPVAPTRTPTSNARLSEIEPVEFPNREGLLRQARTEEDRIAETKALDLSDKLTSSYNKEMYGEGDKAGLTQLEGDPVGDYDRFQTRFDSQRQELEDGVAGMSDRSQRIIKARLDFTKFKLDQTTTIQKARQYDAYADNVTKATIENFAQEFTDDIAKQDVEGADLTLEDLENVYELNATRKGQVDEKGNLDTVGQQGLNNLISSTVSNSVLSLLDSGDVRLAQETMKKYGSMVSPKVSGKIKKELRKEEINQMSLRLAEDLANRPPDEIEKELSKVKDLEVRAETRKNVTSILRQQRNTIADYGKESFRDFVQFYKEYDFKSVEELEANPTYRTSVRHWNKSQIDALKNDIIRPKTTDLDAQENLLEVWMGGGLKGMPVGDFTQLKSKLGGVYRRLADRLYIAANKKDKETRGLKPSALLSKVDTAFRASTLYKKIRNKETTTSKENRNKIRAWILDNYENLFEGRTQVEQFKEIDNIMVEYEKGQTDRSFLDRIFGVENRGLKDYEFKKIKPKKVGESPSPQDITGKLNWEDFFADDKLTAEMRAKFKTQNNNVPHSNATQLYEFYLGLENP